MLLLLHTLMLMPMCSINFPMQLSPPSTARRRQTTYSHLCAATIDEVHDEDVVRNLCEPGDVDVNVPREMHLAVGAPARTKTGVVAVSSFGITEAPP